MSKLISLKDSVKAVVEGNSSGSARSGNILSNLIQSSENILDTLKIIYQYMHAKNKIESATKLELQKIMNDYDERMKTLSQNVHERNQSLEQAKELIKEGIRTSNEVFILNGIAILKDLITNPLKRG